jgi:hypothetical protein
MGTMRGAQGSNSTRRLKAHHSSISSDVASRHVATHLLFFFFKKNKIKKKFEKPALKWS